MAYSIHCRKRTTSKAQPVTQAAELPEEVVLDENEVAKGLDYCVVDECEPSPSHKLLAYSLDTTGYETYEVHISLALPLPTPGPFLGLGSRFAEAATDPANTYTIIYTSTITITYTYTNINTTPTPTPTPFTPPSSSHFNPEQVRILDLATRQVIDTIPETSGSVEWGVDDSTFFYLKVGACMRISPRAHCCRPLLYLSTHTYQSAAIGYNHNTNNTPRPTHTTPLSFQLNLPSHVRPSTELSIVCTTLDSSLHLH
jgi:hypothetical protein